ncbi:hypothetical protein HQN64_19740 [Enterobacteriaceae bacterium BIT-l23]|jgi:hypothetical protein|uniref:hypothetical protein n=1 Tax=Jejubacter sp. L23 TaxID=3092086 RepID=UPI0015851365|nr:hypothetical protein [Enterobacteriaceae bacterium BIT-l23]
MRPVGYSVIARDIYNYAHDMNQFWKNLQKESIAEWMLIMAIACWGIPDRFFQIWAFILTALFFSGKLLRFHNRMTFAQMESKIRAQIAISTLPEEARLKLNRQLEKVRSFRRFRNSSFVLRRNWRFLAGYLFLGASVIKVLFFP